MSSKRENLFIIVSILFGIMIISFSWIYSQGLKIQNNQIQSRAQSNEADHSHNQTSRSNTSVGCGV